MTQDDTAADCEHASTATIEYRDGDLERCEDCGAVRYVESRGADVRDQFFQMRRLHWKLGPLSAIAAAERRGAEKAYRDGVLKAVERFKFHIRNEPVSLNSLMEIALELERSVGVDRMAAQAGEASGNVHPPASR